MTEINKLFGNGDFFTRKETKEQTAQAIVRGDRNAFIDVDGIAKCKKCKTPKMFHEIYRFEDGNVLDKWLPVVCKCEFAEMEQERKEKAEKDGWAFEPKSYL